MKATTPAIEIHDLSPAELTGACRALLAAGGRMQMAYAWTPAAGEPPEVRYLATRPGTPAFSIWRCRPEAARLPSLAHGAPLLGWYEREMRDLFGIEFEGHPEPFPLVLPEGMRPSLPPMDPRATDETVLPAVAAAWQSPEVLGEEVQRLPFGPIRAGVLESAQMVFFYVGEGILHFDPHLFFKHRGMEKQFEGHRPEIAVLLAERISGVGSVAHALGFCQAVESAAETEVPIRARLLRVVLAELERIYNHLHYFGNLCHTTTLKVGEAEGLWLEERCKQINARFTGSRFLRGLLIPGGLRRDLDAESGLDQEWGALMPEIHRYLKRLSGTRSHLDRLLTTGTLDLKTAFDQGATGPVERASGLDRDLRRDHPYAGYEEVPPRVALQTSGDAFARAVVRAEELEASVEVIRRVIARLRPGAVRVPCTPPKGGEGLGWAESPRGSLYYAAHFDQQGRLARVKIKSPSFSNWRVFPFTVHDSNMMDYAINEASFGLTVAGCAR